jgi:hypothetical protein
MCLPKDGLEELGYFPNRWQFKDEWIMSQIAIGRERFK